MQEPNKNIVNKNLYRDIHETLKKNPSYTDIGEEDHQELRELRHQYNGALEALASDPIDHDAVRQGYKALREMYFHLAHDAFYRKPRDPILWPGWKPYHLLTPADFIKKLEDGLERTWHVKRDVAKILEINKEEEWNIDTMEDV